MRLAALRQEALAQAASQARQTAEREEAARQQVELAAQAEAARQEAARQQVAQAERARQQAAEEAAERQAAARQDAAQQEAARQQTARESAAQQQVDERQAAQARREERLKAIGRQLNEEADQRQAAAEVAARLPPSVSSQRRIKLFGRSDPNAELVLYAEAWARKIQMNTPADTVRELAQLPHTQPVVTVAVRADGSVESVTLELSSGVAAIDAAIERIVRSQASYPAFSRALASQYDVIEIRRTWQFDMAVRLY